MGQRDRTMATLVGAEVASLAGRICSVRQNKATGPASDQADAFVPVEQQLQEAKGTLTAGLLDVIHGIMRSEVYGEVVSFATQVVSERAMRALLGEPNPTDNTEALMLPRKNGRFCQAAILPLAARSSYSTGLRYASVK